jgi:formylglycine-generating enzyme required for sulfatase activity
MRLLWTVLLFSGAIPAAATAQLLPDPRNCASQYSQCMQPLQLAFNECLQRVQPACEAKCRNVPNVRSGGILCFKFCLDESECWRISAHRAAVCRDRFCQGGAARPSCPHGMIYFDPGSQSRFEPLAGPADSRRTPLSVAGFCLDVTEVTVSAYSECVRRGRCGAPFSTVYVPGAPEGWEQKWSQYCNTDLPGRSNHPVNCVDWDQAHAYCSAVGKRLPLREEFEWAARGTVRGSPYPWGADEPSRKACWNGDGNDLGTGKRLGTCDVGSYPKGDSREGVKDLAGNVWEWTSATVQCPSDRQSRECVLILGGSWREEDPKYLMAAGGQAVPHAQRGSSMGFRCALSRSSTEP